MVGIACDKFNRFTNKKEYRIFGCLEMECEQQKKVHLHLQCANLLTERTRKKENNVDYTVCLSTISNILKL